MPPAGRSRRRLNDAAAEAGIVLVALTLMLAAAAGGFVVGRETADGDGGGGEAAAESTEPGGGVGTDAGTDTGSGGETDTGGGETDTGGDGGGAGGDAAAGQEVFASAGCASCHTFEDAGASGSVGPNLDQSGLSQDEIVQTVSNGRGGMPPFKDRLSADEIAAVAAYVAENRTG